MILDENYVLSNGVEIPKIGLGTWLIRNELVGQAVKDAIEIGYRHIDTAQAYQNEEGVGEGIKASGISRNEIFITSKVAAEIKEYGEARTSIDESLTKLGVEHIDLMIIHSPKPWKEFRGDNHYFEGNREVWKALEEAYDAGKIRAIGVSNFQKVDLDNIFEVCNVKPIVNQILTHVTKTPLELINYCKEHDVMVEAYSPIGHGKLLDNPPIAEMAAKYGVSVPQLCIRYTLQLDLVSLPKSKNRAHIQSNAELAFKISEEDMCTLINMNEIEDYGDAKKFPVFRK